MKSYRIKSFFFILLISSIYSSLPININKKIEKRISKEPLNIKETYNYFRQLSYTCASTSYSKNDIQE